MVLHLLNSVGQLSVCVCEFVREFMLNLKILTKIFDNSHGKQQCESMVFVCCEIFKYLIVFSTNLLFVIVMLI